MRLRGLALRRRGARQQSTDAKAGRACGRLRDLLLQVVAVGDQRVDHLGPRAVEGLVPDGRLEALHAQAERRREA